MPYIIRPGLKLDNIITVGVDEVGRGALAGPVVAAAVCFAPDFFVSDEACSWGNMVKDSKQLTYTQRKNLAKKILAAALAVGLGQVSHTKIDRLNIHQATMQAMGAAVKQVMKHVEFKRVRVVVDGKFTIPDLKVLQTAEVKADQSIFEVSAASIVAKVFRDNLMIKLSKKIPEYSFEKHKGYGTLEHRQAIVSYGLSAVHRRSFCKNADRWLQ